MSSDSDIVLEAVFVDGHSLISGLKLLSQFVSQANFIFTPNSISLTRQGKSGSTIIIFNIAIDPANLLKYKYNAVDESNKQVEELTVGIDFSKFNDSLKSVKRKTIITFLMKAGDDNLYIHTSGDNNGSSILETPIVEEIVFPLENYIRSNPICKASIDDFSSFMTKAHNTKCKQIYMRPYSEGVLIFGRTSDGKIPAINKFGSVPENADDEEKIARKKIKINIRTSTKDTSSAKDNKENKEGRGDKEVSFDGKIAGALTKLNKLSGRSIVNVDINPTDKGSLICFNTPFSTFGQYNILIHNKE